MSLSRFKNIHSNDRVFIIGNGPSLEQTPLRKLQDEKTIAMNKINLIYDDTCWRPDYFIFSDEREEWIDDVQQTIDLGIPCFISDVNKNLFRDRENIYTFNRERPGKEGRKKAINTNDLTNIWANDITDTIYNFGSTISVAAQVSHYMGFNEIYFIGCDLYSIQKSYMIFKSGGDPREYDSPYSSSLRNGLRFILEDGKPIRSIINAIAFKLNTVFSFYRLDKNHFDENYQPQKSYHKRMNKKHREVHEIIQIASEIYGFNVYNATVGGNLEVHERIDLESILESN